MSILGEIVSAIFHRSAPPASAAPGGSPGPQAKPASPQPTQPAAQGSQVDVAAIMDKLAAQSKEKLDWQGPKRAKKLGIFPKITLFVRLWPF
jgi:hypothetical protein